MSLFFDKEWFDARLRAVGLSREALAQALGLTEREVGELWKDQRELTKDNVRILAALLDTSATEVAQRAGISTPVPANEEPPAASGILERLERIEKLLAALRQEIADLKKG